MKKIAVIGLKGLPAFGGASTVGQNIIKQLKSKYWFTVYSIDSHTNINGKDIDIEQHVFRSMNNKKLSTLLYYFKSLFHCLFCANYDLIHLHHAESGFITPFLRLKYKVIVTFHGGYNAFHDPKFSTFTNSFFRFSEKLNLISANRIVTVSKIDYQLYLNKKYKNVSFIPNGINIPKLNNSHKSSGYLCFAASRIYEIKGLHLALMAIRKIDIPKKIVIIGNIDLVSDYKKSIHELAAGMNVEFTGLIKEKRTLFECISKAEIFIFPSLKEAMSMILLEVIALKVPIIASDIPENKILFSDDELLFFKSDDSDDLASKLIYALQHKEEMIERSHKAFERINKQYKWEKIGYQYESLYQELLH
jgi:glycosyltransferase involved in cell wall biosynthesis